MTKRLAEVLGVPVAFCDATQYSETGYVGACVEEMLIRLQNVAADNPKGADYGIVFIDEIDKISAQSVGNSHNSERDVSGLSVQQELLKLLEGDKIFHENRQGRAYSFNVKNVLFIAAGAFQGLPDIISERVAAKSRIGFKNQAAAGGEVLNTTELLQQVKPQDIIKYGFMPELVGRFPNIIPLDKLTRVDFLAILSNQRISLIEHYRTFFARNGIELEIPAEFHEEMATQAAGRDLGARGLNAAVENFFSRLVYDLLEMKKSGELHKINIMNCLGGTGLKERLG
jgi:ATP-dependent Clp protease ATP-binding subunit ClpX